ncbi:hypothetical protein K8P10_001986 [Leucobacter sp. Psy1]|uniref:hypothetical protein n=1 Tax=Leucobacter sp. Psy1 TaxID=2875729 RepID=UPI001CD6DF75|nr:hypothetical protein [Leucobacter sp. Psy1]UBH06475.1 hypothetical protein K8P10_001986 [Leucobacter sp. Psy1]
MAEHLAFDDVEDEVAGYLFESTGVASGEEVPNPKPNEFHEVEQIGGGMVTPVSGRTLLLIKSHGPTKRDAGRVARAARTAMARIRRLGDNPVYEVEVGAERWSPDPDTEGPRYQFPVTLHSRVTITQAP